MSSQSPQTPVTWAELERRSLALLDSYDRSIQRILDVERSIADDLAQLRVDVEEDLIGSEAEESSDDAGSFFDDVMYFRPEPSRGPHIRIDPVPRFIDSPDLFARETLHPHALRFSEDGTVIMDYTPSHYQVRDGEDSDTETIVDEWEEPWSSP